MAFASIITSAIGILLLIITAYVLVAGTVTITQVAVNAQTDMTALHSKTLGTAITIESTNISAPDILYLSVRNSGTEPITDLSHTDVLLMQAGQAPKLYVKDTGWSKVSINPDSIHPNQLDPGEVLNMSVSFAGNPIPDWVQVTTGNGAYSSSYL